MPATRFFKGAFPKGHDLPALMVGSIGRTPWQTLGSGLRFSRSRIRVTVRAIYDQIDPILDEVRLAMADRRGAIAGASDVAVLLDIEGPDFFDPATNIFERHQDFRIAFSRPD